MKSIFQLFRAGESGRGLTGTTRGTLYRVPEAEREARAIVPVGHCEVLISGWRADQTSADAAIAGGFAGVLTYSLVEAPSVSETPLSYRELHDQTCAELKRGRYEQIPQFEGSDARLGQPFFSPLE